VWKRFSISFRDRIIEMWAENKSMDFFLLQTRQKSTNYNVEDNFILKYVFEIWSLKCGNVSNTI
jgi:hypothetical protein